MGMLQVLVVRTLLVSSMSTFILTMAVAFECVTTGAANMAAVDVMANSIKESMRVHNNQLRR
jgi:hypothetical protein